MNKFSELIEQLKERAKDRRLHLDDFAGHDDDERALPSGGVQNGNEHGFRLPYSSDPESLEKPWK